jgi:hypothetical protein
MFALLYDKPNVVPRARSLGHVLLRTLAFQRANREDKRTCLRYPPLSQILVSETVRGLFLTPKTSQKSVEIQMIKIPRSFLLRGSSGASKRDQLLGDDQKTGKEHFGVLGTYGTKPGVLWGE